MDLVPVHVIDVSISKVQQVVHTTLKQSPQKGVVLILYVLVEFTDVVLENVTDVMDVLLM
jgi:hypothetical protein